LTGGVSLGEELGQNPAPEWLSERLWGEINRMSKLTNFTGYLKHFNKNVEFYKKMYDSTNPNEIELPSDISHYNKFQFLCIMRCIRPDILVPSIADFVVSQLGAYFITPPEFDLGVVFKDSTSSTPLIFVLSPGADPLASL
jgi:dynein heavy chain